MDKAGGPWGGGGGGGGGGGAKLRCSHNTTVRTVRAPLVSMATHSKNESVYCISKECSL